MKWALDSKKYKNRLQSTMLYREAGKISKSLGLIYEARLPRAAVGSLCEIISSPEMGEESGVQAEVIGFRGKDVILMPFENVLGAKSNSHVVLRQTHPTLRVGFPLLGRILDGRGNPIDGLGPIHFDVHQFEDRPLYSKPSDVLKREMISQPLDLGIRALNGLLTCGKGQRVGVMAGSGVGKSVLLGMMARNTQADVNVIALVGERGREVREFVERDLGTEGLKRSVIVVATSDSSPLLRVRAAFLAAAIAEYFRDQGKDVLFLMDSITRFSMAQREIGLSMGEPPASKGYTPSVFALLPRLLERAGTAPEKGSVTGLFTVLVEGDDLDDPIADASRSFLDGHIVLSRSLAERGHYPAIDVLQSASRVMDLVVDPTHRQWAQQIREWLALYRQVEDLINLGAYVRGSNQKIDQAVMVQEKLTQFLRQGIQERSNMDTTRAAMHSLIRLGEAFIQSQNADATAATATRQKAPSIQF